MTSVHHSSVMQNSFMALRILCAPPVHFSSSLQLLFKPIGFSIDLIYCFFSEIGRRYILNFLLKLLLLWRVVFSILVTIFLKIIAFISSIDFWFLSFEIREDSLKISDQIFIRRRLVFVNLHFINFITASHKLKKNMHFVFLGAMKQFSIIPLWSEDTLYNILIFSFLRRLILSPSLLSILVNASCATWK